jgi:acyl carrier protein
VGVTIEAKVAEILETMLGRPVAPGATVMRSKEDTWDSLKHLEIFFALEDGLGVRFSPEEVVKLDSMEAICRCVERHRAA